ncbi:FTX1 [Auxenochlorella protothecoides x Auxenochlorella symbiontica]
MQRWRSRWRSVSRVLGQFRDLNVGHGPAGACPQLLSLQVLDLKSVWPADSPGRPRCIAGTGAGLHASIGPEAVTELTEKDFHVVCESTLEELQDKLDQGVLTLRLGTKGTYVINKQAPNHQIWSSSPVSGPVRYDYIDGRWVYRRDGHDLLERLETEVKELTGLTIHLS